MKWLRWWSGQRKERRLWMRYLVSLAACLLGVQFQMDYRPQGGLWYGCSHGWE
jgi:hypothetical protein